MTSTVVPKKSGHAVGARSAARLGAVQALYQLELSDAPSAAAVVQEFLDHRLGHEIEGAQYATADGEFFRDVVMGTHNERTALDERIAPALARDWPLSRLEIIVRAILRAGTYELTHRLDVPTKVILNEYVEVTKAFYDDDAPGFVNGVLHKLAQDIRPGT